MRKEHLNNREKLDRKKDSTSSKIMNGSNLHQEKKKEDIQQHTKYQQCIFIVKVTSKLNSYSKYWKKLDHDLIQPSTQYYFLTLLFYNGVIAFHLFLEYLY